MEITTNTTNEYSKLITPGIPKSNQFWNEGGRDLVNSFKHYVVTQTQLHHQKRSHWDHAIDNILTTTTRSDLGQTMVINTALPILLFPTLGIIVSTTTDFIIVRVSRTKTVPEPTRILISVSARKTIQSNPK